MNKRYKELVKNTGLLTISNFSSKILVFLLLPIYSSVLTQGEYGFYDLVYTSIQLLFPLTTIDISEAVMRFLIDASDNQRSIISIAIKYVIASCLFAGIILLVNSFYIFSDMLNIYAPYILVYYFVHSIHSLQNPILKGQNKVRTIAISSIIGTVTMISANIFLLLVVGLGLEGFFIANILGQLVPTLFIVISDKQWRYICVPKGRDLERQMVRYSLPLAVDAIGWVVNNTSDRYIVSILCNVETNGLLSVAYKIPSIVSVLGAIFLQAWQISAMKEYTENENSTIFGELFDKLCAILAIVSGLLILFSETIAKIMFGNFVDGWVFIPLLILSVLLNQASGFIGPILNAKMNSKAMAQSAAISITANIILNILLTKIMGAIGVAVATAIASALLFFIRERATDGEIRTKNYYQIVLSWVILAGIAILVTFFKALSVAWLLFIIVIFIYRKTILFLYIQAVRFLRKILFNKSLE